MAVCKECERYKVCLVHCSESVLRNRGICEHFKNGWISVKERIPEATDVYLVNAVHRYNKNDGYRSPQIRLYFKDDNEWQGLPDLYEVTHWMPLPEPPKEE